MPVAFKEQYPNTRLIIDCIEFGIKCPSSLVTQAAATFSSYKNKNIVMVLIGIMSSVVIVFISHLLPMNGPYQIKS